MDKKKVHPKAQNLTRHLTIGERTHIIEVIVGHLTMD